MMLNVGAFFGISAFSHISQRIGHRPTFAIGFVLALLSTAMVFLYLEERSQIFWMLPIMGFCQLSLFGGYAVYFPELFPTHLRGTGESFAANIGGRLIGTCFAWVTATLATTTDLSFAPTKLAYTAAAIGFAVYLGGFILSFFLPEPKSEDLKE